jgi:DnaK suppressor protein
MATVSLPRRHRSTTRISPAQLAELRGMLLEQQAFRIEQLAHLTATHGSGDGATGLVPGDAVGGAGAGGGTSDGAYAEITDSLTAGARTALRDVRAALARMAAGRYGRCTHCDAALTLERLEILPQVALCVPCQRSAAG